MGLTAGRLPEQRPWAQPTMRLRPTEVVSEDELEAIHLASLRILRDIGIDFLDAESRAVAGAAGADVEADGARVRFDPDLVTERIATAPASFRLHSWNPDRTLTIGGDHLAFGSVGSPPNYVDLDGGAAPARGPRSKSCCASARCSTSCTSSAATPSSRSTSIPPCATSTPPSTCSPSPTSRSTPTASGRQRNRDVLELARIARGVDEATLEREPSVFTVVNSSLAAAHRPCRCCRASSSCPPATRSS